MKKHSVTQWIVALFIAIFLIASPTLAQEATITSDDDNTPEEQTDSTEEMQEGESDDEEKIKETKSCDNLKGLDRALCRVGQQLDKKGIEHPTCAPGEKHTQLQRAYCMIKRNKEAKENRKSRYLNRRSIQKARRPEYRGRASARTARFKELLEERRKEMKEEKRKRAFQVRPDIEERRRDFVERRARLRRGYKKVLQQERGGGEGRDARRMREKSMQKDRSGSPRDQWQQRGRRRTQRRERIGRRTSGTEERRVRIRATPRRQFGRAQDIYGSPVPNSRVLRVR